MKRYDVIIVGGGIVGLACAYQILQKMPKLKIAVLEKEAEVSRHQTGRNSGVIHSGIYYKPGSLKASNCVRGVKMLLDFCEKKDIPYQLCGKLIVATKEDEIPKLKELYQRGVSNGVLGLKILNSKEIKKIEPYARGVCAIHSPNTGIVDYRQVSKQLLQEIRLGGADVFFNSSFITSKQYGDEVIVQTQDREFACQFLINCAGLHADRVARKSGQAFKEKIIPFRGEYYFLDSKVSHFLKGLIYPVPNPKFPFLGVHLTKRISGEVELGPNAVLALAKEGYQKSNIHLKELAHFAKYRGFWAMSARYWKVGLYEMYRSFSKKQFLKDIQKLVPEISEEHLKVGGSGVRAQVVSPIGKMVDDFLIYNSKRAMHVLNAPSPGATSSLSIGSYLAENLEKRVINLQVVE